MGKRRGADPRRRPGEPQHRGGRGRRHRQRHGIRDRFAQLHADCEQAEAQLAALARRHAKDANPSLLDQLPLAGDILPGLTPQLKADLFAAFDL